MGERPPLSGIGAGRAIGAPGFGHNTGPFRCGAAQSQVNLHDLDWKSAFAHVTQGRGKAYARGDRVHELQPLDGEGLHWRARVQGSARTPYRCEVLVSPRSGREARVRADCACLAPAPCKHAYAVLAVAQTHGDEMPTATDAVVPRRHDAKRPIAAPSPDEWERWLEPPTPAAVRAEIAREALGLVLMAGTTGDPPTLLAGMAYWQPGKTKPWVSPQPLFFGDAGEPAPRLHGGWPDEDLLALAALLPRQHVRAGPLAFAPLRGRALERAVEHLLPRYRVCWERIDQALRPGPSLSMRCRWEALPDGSQRLRAEPGREGLLLLQGHGWWYVDLGGGEIGRVEDAEGLARRAQTAPVLRPEVVSALRQRLARTPSGASIPVPAERQTPRELRAAPRLTLHLSRFQPDRSAYGAQALEAAGTALIGFDYAGERVASEGEARERRWREGELIEIVRDARAEHALIEGLRQRHLLAPSRLPWPTSYAFDRLDDAQRLLAPPPKKAPLAPEHWQALLNELRQQGAELSYEPDFPRPLREIEVGDWDAELSAAGNAWFELTLGIDIDGERQDLLPILRRLLLDPAFPLRPKRGESPTASWRVELDEQRALRLPLARLRALLAPLLDLLLRDEATPRLHRSQGDVLAALQGAVRWRGDERLRQRLVDLSTRPPRIAAPPGFKAKLRPYQRDGLGWLEFLAAAGLGGVLADDMGLGKTVQVLAHVLTQTQRATAGFRTLVVAPTSLMGNWQAEAARFAPALKVLLLHGADRADRFDAIAAHDLILTTYPLLPRDRERLMAHEFDLLVLDEAQAVKNAKSQAAHVVRELRARRRLAMTGTPLENHLGELWAQFDAIEPGLLGSERDFARFYRHPIEKHGDAERQRRLTRRIGPLLLRRRKDEVLRDLPPKTEIVRTLELEGAQRELYESLRLAQHRRVREAIAARGLAQSGIVVLDALLKLRQACCDPRLVKLPAARQAKDSAKLDALLELLATLLDEGRRVLLFSQFTAMLDLIESALKKRGIAHLRLDGDTPARTRAGLVQRFQRGDAALFLISLKAGGVGLNLTAADTVIHYDPWWNPAVENQATDRAHRIGQDKRVFVYKLICAGTVEEKILALQQRKADLADAVLEGGRSTKARFDESDLAELFAPLR